mmetsp:Transcript_17463/g.35471  ORF Transcript_17463/g.35471 Transcript_17463/m.35471 type:complete len:116 (+) Transcript_17463:157-504(+)
MRADGQRPASDPFFVSKAQLFSLGLYEAPSPLCVWVRLCVFDEGRDRERDKVCVYVNVVCTVRRDMILFGGPPLLPYLSICNSFSKRRADRQTWEQTVTGRRRDRASTLRVSSSV